MKATARIIAVANQKGGVAKTTTVASLGVALAELGRRVLVVDLDPQACLTFSLGLDPEALDLTVHDVILGRVNAAMAIVDTAQAVQSDGTTSGPDLLPAKIDLVGCEAALQSKTGREYRLQSALEEISGSYDEILIDCPPSLGLLTINGLTAAHEVLVPLQCEALAHRGVGQLLDTVHDVQRFTNRGLTVRGVLPTMYDGRTSHAHAVLEDITSRYSLTVLDPPIAKSVRFAEAPGQGRSVLVTSRRTPGAESYRIHARLLAGLPVPKARIKAAAGPAANGRTARAPIKLPVKTPVTSKAAPKIAASAPKIAASAAKVSPARVGKVGPAKVSAAETAAPATATAKPPAAKKPVAPAPRSPRKATVAS